MGSRGVTWGSRGVTCALVCLRVEDGRQRQAGDDDSAARGVREVDTLRELAAADGKQHAAAPLDRAHVLVHACAQLRARGRRILGSFDTGGLRYWRPQDGTGT
eukprot:3058949-Prymnesium_polylepis.3